MEQSYFIEQAFNLTLFGMGFVFMFLTLLVFVTKAMSALIQKLTTPSSKNPKQSLKNEIDEETKFVIKQAIKMHREA